MKPVVLKISEIIVDGNIQACAKNCELYDCQSLPTLRCYESLCPIYQIPFLKITFTTPHQGKSVLPRFHTSAITSPSLCCHYCAFPASWAWVLLLSMWNGLPFGYPQRYYLVQVLGKLLEIALKAASNLIITPVMSP